MWDGIARECFKATLASTDSRNPSSTNKIKLLNTSPCGKSSCFSNPCPPRSMQSKQFGCLLCSGAIRVRVLEYDLSQRIFRSFALSVPLWFVTNCSWYLFLQTIKALNGQKPELTLWDKPYSPKSIQMAQRLSVQCKLSGRPYFLLPS